MNHGENDDSATRLRKISTETGAAADATFVVIPGIDTKHPESWADESGKSWLELPHSTQYRVQILVFEYQIKLIGPSLWQRLLDAGTSLLHSLDDLQRTDKNERRPIVLIAHSLGGILVKQALCLAYMQLSHYREIVDMICGICFLGTPHPTIGDPEILQNLMSILRLSPRNLQNNLFHDRDADDIANLSLRFQEVLETPVFSIYETKETKIKNSHRLRPSKRVLLVGEALARTCAPEEELFALDCDHNALCDISTRGQCYDRLVVFLKSVVETTQLALKNVSDYKAASALDRYTMRSSSFDLSDSRPLNTQQSMFTAPQTAPHTGDGTATSAEGSLDTISHVSNFIMPKKEARLPCYMFSVVRNPSFFGRQDELQLLEEALLPFTSMNNPTGSRSKTLKTFAICGPGGIGKTQLAADFVLTHMENYDAVFWLHGNEAAKMADGFGRIAVELGLVVAGSVDARDQVVSRDLVKGWLANPLKPTSPPEEASWLLVFDNVDTPDILDDFWPVDGTGSVLVTSRDPLAKTNVYYGTQGIDLKPFSSEVAADFLIQLTQRRQQLTERETAGAVADRLGGLPLAITQMAGTISRRHLSFQEFLQWYETEESHRELLSLQISGSRTGYSHSLASVWALERLEVGAALLEVLSLLDSDRIYEFILTQSSTSIVLKGYPKTTTAYHKARAELLQSSLVSRNTDQQRILIHRLIQDAARARMPPTRFRDVFEAAVELLWSVWPQLDLVKIHNVARWARCEPLFPHVISLKKLYTQSVFPHHTRQQMLPFAKLLNEAGWYLYDRGYVVEGDSFAAIAQEICEPLANSDQNPELASEIDDLLSEIHHTRGALATDMNEPKRTLAHNQIFLDLRLQMNKLLEYRTQDSWLAVAYNEMGVAYMANGLWEKGLEAFMEAESVYLKFHTYAGSLISLVCANQGLGYWLLGRYDDAFNVLMKGLKGRETKFGIDDIESMGTGRLLHALGNVTFSQGRFEESFQYHQRALRQLKLTLGNSRTRTAAVSHRVAGHFFRLKQYEAALKFLDQALKVYGTKSNLKPERARTGFKKGRVLLAMQRPIDAQAWLDDAVALRRELVPKDKREAELLSDDDFDDLVVFWTK